MLRWRGCGCAEDSDRDCPQNHIPDMHRSLHGYSKCFLFSASCYSDHFGIDHIVAWVQIIKEVT